MGFTSESETETLTILEPSPFFIGTSCGLEVSDDSSDSAWVSVIMEVRKILFPLLCWLLKSWICVSREIKFSKD